MVIKEAKYIGSFVNLTQLTSEGGVEIALIGRSNVGKSSFINKVVQRKNLAKSSSTPGKTRTINYFQINSNWYFVDLPGYGYAKVSKRERMNWSRMIETYLQNRETLKGVIMLIDFRHPPQENDKEMKKWLDFHNLPILLVATKIDKVSRNLRGKHLHAIRAGLGLGADDAPICFSAETGEGVEDVKMALSEIITLAGSE
ncbi:MAG: ribosome biogenesis GTP-binding protein YihA/YsxC [Syntrophomonadaceae bacterium]|jgi:GTP-binding protein|nr:ribosome biogenesis GTP-binding protein YihA/YsxC [Syntrophomonadaceae bacterium]